MLTIIPHVLHASPGVGHNGVPILAKERQSDQALRRRMRKTDKLLCIEHAVQVQKKQPPAPLDLGWALNPVRVMSVELVGQKVPAGQIAKILRCSPAGIDVPVAIVARISHGRVPNVKFEEQ